VSVALGSGRAGRPGSRNEPPGGVGCAAWKSERSTRGGSIERRRATTRPIFTESCSGSGASSRSGEGAVRAEDGSRAPGLRRTRMGSQRCGRLRSGGAPAGMREQGRRGRQARGDKTEQTRDEETPARCRGFLCAGFWNCGGKGQQTTRRRHTGVG